MRVLFDQGVPSPLRVALSEHLVSTAREMGWDTLKNGELLSAAEIEFEVFVTTDQSLKYQQNLQGRRLAMLVLPTTSWPRIQPHAAAISDRIGIMGVGEYVEFQMPAD